MGMISGLDSEDWGDAWEAFWWEIFLYCCAAALVLVLISVGVHIFCFGAAGCFISGGKPCGSNMCHGACSCCCNNKTEPMDIPVQP